MKNIFKIFISVLFLGFLSTNNCVAQLNMVSNTEEMYVAKCYKEFPVILLEENGYYSLVCRNTTDKMDKNDLEILLGGTKEEALLTTDDLITLCDKNDVDVYLNRGTIHMMHFRINGTIKGLCVQVTGNDGVSLIYKKNLKKIKNYLKKK